MKKQRILSLLLSVCVVLSLVPFSAMAAEGEENFQSKRTYQPGQFRDVPASSWYETGVRSVYELGLMDGSSATTFSPDGNVTIAELIKITATLHSIYATGHGVDTSENSTSGVASVWYAPYVNYANQNGLIALSNGKIDYSKKATRLEVAELLVKVMPLPSINQIAQASIPFSDAPSPADYFSSRKYFSSDEWGNSRAIEEDEIPYWEDFGRITTGYSDSTGGGQYYVLFDLEKIYGDALHYDLDGPYVERYRADVYTLYRAGIMTGSDAWGSFDVSAAIKRSEMAALVTRLAVPAQRKDLTLDGKLDEALRYLGQSSEVLPADAVFTYSDESGWETWYELPALPGVSCIVTDGTVSSLWLKINVIFPGKTSVTLKELRSFLPDVYEPNGGDDSEGAEAVSGHHAQQNYWCYPDDPNQIKGLFVKNDNLWL